MTYDDDATVVATTMGQYICKAFVACEQLSDSIVYTMWMHVNSVVIIFAIIGTANVGKISIECVVL